MPEQQSEGFIQREVEEPRKSKKKRIVIKLGNEGTSIEWNDMDESDRELLMQLLVNDPDALTSFASHLQEQTGPQVADTTVVAIANAFLVGEAAVISLYGPKMIPVLKNIPLPIAIKACTVSQEEMKPVMDAGKRVVAKWVPESALRFQDELVLLEHIGKLGGEKFKACLDLAIKMEQYKESAKKEKEQKASVTPININENPNSQMNGHATDEVL